MAYRSRERRFDRIGLLGLGSILVAGVVVAKLFLLQVVQHGLYVALAQGQRSISEKLSPVRGEFFFRDFGSPSELLPLAINREVRLVYAVPKNVQDPLESAKELTELLSMEETEIFDRLNRPDDGYEPLKHEVDIAVAEQIEKLQLPGIQTAPETNRYYPHADIASHLTGFLGYDGDHRIGQYGLEGFFEEQLAGEPGYIEAESDGAGRVITVGSRTLREARNGDSLILTIDRTVQHTVCKKLETAVAKHGADGGSVIIVNPKTGAIIAMCSVPNFNANEYAEEPLAHYINHAIADQYEPGSVMKTITLGAALDLDLITPETTYEDSGSVTIGPYTIRNSDGKSYRKQTMLQVLEQSINTGAIFVVRELGPTRFREYLERFGFGELTEIELQGEASGDISTLSRPGEIWSATASFGQGITVTPLQLIMAYAAIANDGKLLKPYLVEEMIKPNGYRQKTNPTVLREVMSPAAALTMKAMLVNVVRNGHGQRAGVPGYYVGGKTGTAQIPFGDRPGYDPGRHIGTFVGFAPLASPAFTMLVKIDVPRDVQFAESSAAPLFGDIAAFLLNYYRIPPDVEIQR